MFIRGNNMIAGRLRPGFIVASLAVFAFSASVNAETFNLDFESLAHGTIVGLQYDGVTISADNFKNNTDLAVAFDTTVDHSPPGTLKDLVGPFDIGPSVLAAGNILIIQRPNDCNDVICFNPRDEGRRGDGPVGEFRFDFDSPVFINSIDFFDVEASEAGAPIQFFNAAGNEIDAGSFSTPVTFAMEGVDFHSWDSVQFNVGGVKSVVVTMGGSGGIDNIRGSSMAIPIPAVAYLFPAGLLAGLGWIRRQSRAD